MKRTTRTVCCTNHCNQCSQHFHSVRAFDLHLDHDGSRWPMCDNPDDVVDQDGFPLLEILTKRGECRIGGRKILRNVVIWTIAGWQDSIASVR